MEFVCRRRRQQPPATDEARPAAVVGPGRIETSQRYQHQQQAAAAADTMREEEFHGLVQSKMERVARWVTECAAAREDADAGTAGAFLLDGETEDLLLQVLISRPKYQGIPTVEEIRQFAGQLRAYNARLWTLGMTKGFFRVGATPVEPASCLPEYPDDIDSLDSTSMHEEEAAVNWRVHGKRMYVRKISPAEEELRDEMIQEYRNIRRHIVNDKGNKTRCRTRSVSAKVEISGKMDGFARSQMTGRKKGIRVSSMAC